MKSVKFNLLLIIASSILFFSFGKNLPLLGVKNIEYINSIFIKVQVNENTTGRFLLDLGSPVTVLDSQFVAQNNIQLDSIDFVSVGGSGNSEPEIMPLYSNMPLIAYGDTLNSYEIIVYNLKKIISIEDGIIGYPFFENRLVYLDYLKQELKTFTNRNLIDNSFKEIPLTFINGKPYFNLTLKINDSLSVEGMFLFDTGSELGIKLDKYYTDSLDLFNKIDKKIISSTKNAGVGGTRYTFMIKADQTKFSNFNIDNLLVHCSIQTQGAGSKKIGKRVGTVGNLFLQNFYIIFDIDNNKVFLKPNSNYYKKFTYIRSGIGLGQLTHRGFEIKNILENSIAYENDIKENDIIFMVDAKQTTELGYFKTRELLQTKGEVELILIRPNSFMDYFIAKKINITDLMDKL